MKAKKWLIGGVSTVIVLVAVGYLLGVAYFSDHFLIGSTIAGVAVDQQSLATAADKVDQALNARTITVTEDGKEIGQLKLADYVSLPSGEEMVTSAKAEQHPWKWPLEIATNSKKDLVALKVKGDVEATMAKQAFQALQIDNNKRTKSQDAELKAVDGGKGYTVQAEKVGNQVSAEAFVKALNQVINAGETTLALDDTYIQPKVKADDDALVTLSKRLDQLAKDPFTVTVGSQAIEIPAETIKNWLSIGKDKQLKVDQAQVDQYLQEWNQANAGLLTAHEFNSTLSGVVSVQPGTYGWYLSREETTPAVVEALNAGNNHVEATVVGKGSDQENFFGNSYVEVDIAHQKMFIYQNGQQVLTTDVATGADVTKTVPGAYQVWNKESPSVLVGTNGHTGEPYRTPVSYWLAFDERGQGIHDASWQPTFGGDWYHLHGSNGCVNVSPSVMGEVFSLVSVGMPVVVF
ncbi:MAG: L,D-transpeptidase family protein [Aerococcus sp.]|nr:L,D-transpeptidase family protein [Aerococcus sp.]